MVPLGDKGEGELEGGRCVVAQSDIAKGGGGEKGEGGWRMCRPRGCSADEGGGEGGREREDGQAAALLFSG